jgi:hypothetical protein
VAENPIIISSSPYEIQDKMRELQKVYYGLEEEDTLKAGFLGYSNEVMSLIARNGVFHRDSLYDEYFLNTASLPKSIYNKAKTYDTEVANAKPATIKAYISIRKKDLINFSTPVGGGVKEFIFGSDYFHLNKFKYMLQFPLKVTLKPTSDGDYSVTSQYDIANKFAEFESIQTPYVKTWMELINREKVVFFVVDIWQVERSTMNFSVYSEDVSENLIFDAKFVDQLAHFKVYYRYKGERYELPAYFDTDRQPSDERYCYYSFPDDETVQVLFSTLPNSFRPQFNSEIEVEMFTTKGTECNFTFKGDILFRFSDSERKEIPIGVVSMTDSAGGQNRPTLIQLKNNIIEQVLVRDNLITEPDLNTFFNKIVNSSSVNGSKISFIKKNDDVLRRLFSSYLLMRDGSGYVIPTNTINMTLTKSDLEKIDYTVNPGSVIMYDDELKDYRFMKDGEYPEDYFNDGKNLLYSNPFLMKISLGERPRVSYFRTTVNKNYPVEYRFVNSNINEEFLIPFVGVKRDSFLDDTYVFTASLSTTLDQVNVINNVLLKGLVKKNGAPVGYFDFDISNIEENEFKAILITDNHINTDGSMNIKNSIRSMIDGEVLENFAIDEDVEFDLAILYKNGYDSYVHPELASMPESADHSTTLIFSSEEPINLFRSMNTIMNSDIYVSNTGLFYVKAIPLVSSIYLNNSDNYFEFFRLIDNYETILMSNIDKLENSTDIDMKFFNTFGVCKYSSVDKTNLSVALNIKLNGNYDYDLDNEIKKFIMARVEESNDRGGLLSVSNLMTQLETTMDEISYIEFRNINGSTEQKIRYLYPDFRGLTSEQIINYVPEYLNVSLNSIKTNSSFNPSIEINYI